MRLTKEERDIARAVEAGEWVPAPAHHTNALIQAAKQYMGKKDARLNLRIPTPVLLALKAKAKKEDMPYQRYIGIILQDIAQTPEPSAMARNLPPKPDAVRNQTQKQRKITQRVPAAKKVTKAKR